MSSLPSQTSAKPLRRSLPTTARGPRLGAVASLALHGVMLAAMVIVFQHNLDLREESHVVPVDLVTIAPKTNVAAAAPLVPQIPKPEEMTAPPMPDLAQAEPAPDIPPPKITVEEPKKQDDLAALLNKLTAPSTAQKTAKTASEATQSAGLSSAMTASLADDLRSQIRLCWHPIPGAPNPADQIVEYDLRLNRDGSVASLELLTQSSNPYTRAAATAASSAVMQCQYANGHTGYQLPPQLYSQWREFRPLRFDPRQMLEQ